MPQQNEKQSHVWTCRVCGKKAVVYDPFLYCHICTECGVMHPEYTKRMKGEK